MWQRDALRRIVARGRLEADDLKELLDLCKQGRGAKNIALKASPLAKVHLPANPGQGAAVSVTAITEVDGVNNLAPGQTLTFEPNGITIIYGDNGAGKSGYARILKRACRARHAGKIEPNVYAQQPPPRASATLAYTIGGVHQAPETWQDSGHPHAVLSAVSVFDSECAAIHIKEKNEVAFRPFGSDVPDELATACQAVKDALTAEQRLLEKSRNPIFLKPSWKETTAVGRMLATLKHDTEDQKIKSLATLTQAESARLERLREDLSKNPAKAAAEQLLKADNVKRVLALLSLAELKTSKTALFSVAASVWDAGLKQEAAHLAAKKAFSGEPLEGVGGEVWRALWDSARRYSTEVAYQGQPFPPSLGDALCVLYQQPLDEAARDRMARFEEFIQKDTERQAQEAQRTSKTAVQELDSLSLSTRHVRAIFQELALQNADLARSARRCLASARLRRCALNRALGSTKTPDLPDAAPSQLAELTQFEATLRTYAIELQKSATAEERKKLEAEFAELNDRALLAGMLQPVQDELERLRSIHFLEQCVADALGDHLKTGQ